MPDRNISLEVNGDRFEQVLADWLQAEERGLRPDISELLRTAPELESSLREFLRNRAGFDKLAPHLAPTATQPPVDVPQLDLPPGSRFGGYIILQEVGHGGRGVVYRVRDPELNRPLAVKVLRPELSDEPDAVRRFLEEAQVMGQLQHPGIVPVHAVSQLPDGRPYFAMKLVQGRTLAELLAERSAPEHDLPRFLVIFQQVCQAVAYAHSRRVIHRDLKPANIMVGAFAEVQVMDWGLAKVLTADVADHERPQGEGEMQIVDGVDTIRTVRTEETGHSSVDGLVVGTFAYMAPEQAKGQADQLGPQADVFGLGAVLCEVLTGQPPYAVLAWKLHLMAAAGDLVDAFARLDRCAAEAELITLAKECLSPEREHRPRDAGEVAERLATYMAGVQERLRRAEIDKAAAQARAEETEAKVKAERRARRLTAGLAGAFGLAACALVGFTLVAGSFAYYRGRTNQKLTKAASDLTNALETAEDQRNQAISANAQLRREQRTTRQMTAGLALDRGRTAWQAGDSSQGLLWMARSLTLAPEDDAALQEAIRTNLAGWIATMPPPRPPLRHPGIVANVRFTPDGRKIVTLSTGSVRREDKVMPDGLKREYLVTRPETVGDPFFEEHVSFPIPTAGNLLQPPPHRPATARGQVFLWDLAGGEPVELKSPPDSQILAVTSDGKIALTAKRQDHFSKPSTVQLWDLSEGKARGDANQFYEPIQWAVCSGDGKTFAALVRNTLFLWDVATGRRLKELPISGHQTRRIELSPEGDMLAVITNNPFGKRSGTPPFPLPDILGIPKSGSAGAIAFYDLAARQQVPGLPGAWAFQEVDSQAAIALGPGGRLVLTVSPSDALRSGPVHLWDRIAKKELQLPYRGRIAFARFSPDGKVLLTAGGRGLMDSSEVVQLWDTATGQRRGGQLLPRGQVKTASFSPDSKLLAIGCGEGEVQVWETATGGPLGRALRHPAPVHAVAFSPDGSKLVTGCSDGLARIWNTHPIRIIQPIRLVNRVAILAAEGSRYLRRSEGNTLRLHDMNSGKPCGEPVPYTEKDRGVVLGPDKRTLVIINEGNTARLWDAVTGKPIGAPLEHIGPVTGIRFSPDRRTILTFVESTIPPPSPIAYRWDVSTGRALGFERNPHVRMASAISPDGRWVLRVLGTSAVVINVSTEKGDAKSLDHHGPIIGGLFSPDSRTLLTIAARSGSWEEARLWDLASEKPLGPPMPHQGPIRARAFSPDGKLVLTGSDDGTAQLWDTNTGKRLGPLMSQGGHIRAVAFHPNGKVAATASDDGRVQIWHVATGQPLGPPLPHPAAASFVAFGTEGELLITAAGDCIRIWKVPQAIPGDANRLLLKAEIETGMELDGGTPRLLDDAERVRRVQLLEEADKDRADEVGPLKSHAH